MVKKGEPLKARKKWRSKTVGINVLTRASERGEGVMLYIPKTECDVYDIQAGDRVEIYIRRRFRERWVQEDDEPVKDLSKANIGRPPQNDFD